MTDFVSASVMASPHGSVAAYALTFIAGLVTSVGPCVAPRYVAIAALAERGRATWTTAAFVAGVVLAYDGLGFGAGLLGMLFDVSFAVYTALAVGLVVSGTWTLVCARAGAPHKPRPPATTGAAFLMGAGSALVVSPCCTPIVAAIVGASTAIGRPLEGVTLLTTFALGHATPLLLAGAAGGRLLRGARTISASQAPAIVAGSLMIALGAYYGALA